MRDSLYIKITENIIWEVNYHLAWLLFYTPLTIFSIYRLRKRRLILNTQLSELEREYKIKQLEKTYRILKLSGSTLTSGVLLRILMLRGGQDLNDDKFVLDIDKNTRMIPLVDNCVDVPEPSYIDNDRILRFLAKKYSKKNINGIIYVTKEALCYLAKNEGLVDFPVTFFHFIRIDKALKFTKLGFLYGIPAIGGVLILGGGLPALPVIGSCLASWIAAFRVNIHKPQIRPVAKLTGRFIQRIGTRKDAVVFDAKKSPLPPVLAPSVEPITIGKLFSEFEITNENIVDMTTVVKMGNPYTDKVFKQATKQVTKRKPGRVVYYSDKIREWAKETKDLAGNYTGKAKELTGWATDKCYEESEYLANKAREKAQKIAEWVKNKYYGPEEIPDIVDKMLDSGFFTD